MSFLSVTSEYKLVIEFISTTCEIPSMLMLQTTFIEKSTFIKVAPGNSR